MRQSVCVLSVCTDLMTQWEKLERLASERFDQSSQLGQLREKIAIMKAGLKTAGECLPVDRFSSVDELKTTISLLKVVTCHSALIVLNIKCF